MINYDDFSKVELKVATVLSAERVEGSEKLLQLHVSLGEDPSTGSGQVRQIVSGIAKSYAPEALIGKQVVVIINLEPRMIMGLESNGMLLAASGESGPVILVPEKSVLSGATIK